LETRTSAWSTPSSTVALSTRTETTLLLSRQPHQRNSTVHGFSPLGIDGVHAASQPAARPMPTPGHVASRTQSSTGHTSMQRGAHTRPAERAGFPVHHIARLPSSDRLRGPLLFTGGAAGAVFSDLDFQPARSREKSCVARRRWRKSCGINRAKTSVRMMPVMLGDEGERYCSRRAGKPGRRRGCSRADS
jgi:hypothetical protein